MTFEPGQTYYFVSGTGPIRSSSLYKWKCLKVGREYLTVKGTGIVECGYYTTSRITIKEMESKNFITKEEYEIAKKLFKNFDTITNMNLRDTKVPLPISQELADELENNLNALKQTLSKIK